jgi:hypothetical protein
MTKTTEGGKTDVADVGRLEWDHVTRRSIGPVVAKQHGDGDVDVKTQCA